MFIHENIKKLNWKKMNNMIPVIVQNYLSGCILMHGYMNQEALEYTKKTELLTFFSRKKKRLWVKGEKSKNFLYVKKIYTDCDFDVILVFVKTNTNTCHLDQFSCFSEKKFNFTPFFDLEIILENRKFYTKKSYVKNLYDKGLNKISQKIGEESIETIIASLNSNNNDLINESSDLIFHLLVLLHYKNLNFKNIIDNLKNRMNISKK